MTIPRLSGLDHTLPLLREGYDFLPRRFERLDTDILQARLLLRKTICMRGREAAEVFYDRSRFRRRKAAPRRVKKTLFGSGGVQGLDDEAHRHRKAMFMRLMGEASVGRLVERVTHHWREGIDEWSFRDHVELLLASREILCRAVCDWADVPIGDDEVPRLAEQLTRLIEAPGAVDRRYWKGRLARIRLNRWAADLIDQVRDGHLDVREDSAVHSIAFFRQEGELLNSTVAAVELLNLLRPTVAIHRYVTFAAMALHEYAGALEALDPAWDPEEEADRRAFVHEVRRHYPFFPLAAARVRAPFEWRGHRFDEGRRVLLDLHGTNHDPRIWDDPDSFRPDRFRGRAIDPFTLIPQGGGDHHQNHRCAGEWITIAITSEVVRLLATEMTYRVPEQDLGIDPSWLPARPASGFIIENVRRAVPTSPAPERGSPPGPPADRR